MTLLRFKIGQTKKNRTHFKDDSGSGVSCPLQMLGGSVSDQDILMPFGVARGPNLAAFCLRTE